MKVFVSYNWSSEKHNEWVLNLGARLRTENGLYVIIDAWDLKGVHDIDFFMKQVTKADKVLVICDNHFKEKADSQQGKTSVEAQFIADEIIKDVKQEKYLFVVRKENEQNDTCQTQSIDQREHYDLTEGESYEGQYKKLVAAIRGKSTTIKPPIEGKRIINNSKISHNSEINLNLSEQEEAILRQLVETDSSYMNKVYFMGIPALHLEKAGAIEYKDVRLIDSNLERLEGRGFLICKSKDSYSITAQGVNYVKNLKKDDLSEQANHILRFLAESVGKHLFKYPKSSPNYPYLYIDGKKRFNIEASRFLDDDLDNLCKRKLISSPNAVIAGEISYTLTKLGEEYVSQISNSPNFSESENYGKLTKTHTRRD